MSLTLTYHLRSVVEISMKNAPNSDTLLADITNLLKASVIDGKS